MIKNFRQWNAHNNLSPVNEDARSSTLRLIVQKTGQAMDDLIRSGYKGIGNLSSKLFSAGADDVAKMEKGFSKVLNVQKEPWWQSLSPKARKAYEKEADDILKKFATGYYNGDEAMINAARKQSDDFLIKAKEIGEIQKSIDDATAGLDDVPRGKIKADLKQNIKDAEKSLEDAMKTGDAEKMKAARQFAKKGEDVFTRAGRRTRTSQSYYSRYGDDFYTQTSSSGRSYNYSRNGVLGRGLEDGADLNASTVEQIGEKGKDGFIKSLLKDLRRGGKENFDEIPKRKVSGKGTDKIDINVNVGDRGGLWGGFKRQVRRLFILGVAVSAGSVIWNLIRDGKQNQATDTTEESMNQQKEELIKNGIALNEIDMNKASADEVLNLFFSGGEEDLPIEDAEELRTMIKGKTTMTDFFAKTSQICFDYPEKYFKEKEEKLKESSNFYGFIEKVNEKVGISKLFKLIEDADGMAAKSIQDTLFVDGKPISLDDYGYMSYSNPNVKILLGTSEPVNTKEIVEECKKFVSFFSGFKRKITNDFIQDEVASTLKEKGKITEEEFKERSKRIYSYLSQQLSEKEEVFVAFVGLVLSYHEGDEPFRSFFGFDSNKFSDTMNAITSLTGNNTDFGATNHIARLYLTLSSEFQSVYSEMGKQRTLYGVLEYSTYGEIMRAIMNLFGLEKVCRTILSTSEGEFQEEFSKEEIEEYQKVIVQIQKNEGKQVTVIPSGELDTETEDAIREMQTKLNLPVTGKPGDKTLKAMNDYLLSLVTAKKSSTPLQP